MPRGWDELVAGRDERVDGSFKRVPSRCYVGGMKLADRVAQCRTPLLVRSSADARIIHLHNAAECAAEVAAAPFRFVLSDELTRLCTALAYSKGARTLDCADLLRVPAERVWIEWCTDPWERELLRYGFRRDPAAPAAGGRRGALLRASRDGRSGLVRTFWSVGTQDAVLASAVEAYFDFGTAEGEEPEPPPGERASPGRVTNDIAAGDDILNRCFRFRYEQTWSRYYAGAPLSPEESAAAWRHALGTLVIDIPVMLAFFLLLGTRAGLPQRPQPLERLNRSRLGAGKRALLEHVEVSAPLLPEYSDDRREQSGGTRHGPRLHHVRGHLCRRGSSLFWRVPHLRGCANVGAVRTRTVTWTFERQPRDPAAGKPSYHPTACPSLRKSDPLR